MSSGDRSLRRRLCGTVRMLASDSAHQAAYLSNASEQAKFQIVADDITTEFGVWFEYARQFLEGGLLSQASFGHLTSLSAMIHAIKPDAEYWTAEALATSPTWARVREQAKIALASMDETGVASGSHD